MCEEIEKYKNKCCKYKKRINEQKVIISSLIKQFETKERKYLKKIFNLKNKTKDSLLRKNKKEKNRSQYDNKIHEEVLNDVNFQGEETEELSIRENLRNKLYRNKIYEDIKEDENIQGDELKDFNKTERIRNQFEVDKIEGKIEENLSINEKTKNEDPKPDSYCYICILQILNPCFSIKTGKLKQNISFEDFLIYCSTTKDILADIKNLQLYVEVNLKGILEYIFDQYDNLKFNEIYHTFEVISTFLSYDDKLIILSDILLLINEPHKLVPFCFAILNSESLKNDILSRTIKKIINHQIVIDWISCENEKIKEYYKKIINEIKLDCQFHNLNIYLKELIKPKEIFINSEFNLDLILQTLSITLVANFLDWKYIYCNFIPEVILPDIEENPSYLFYLGSIWMHFYKDFGFRQDSIFNVFIMIENYIMTDNLLLCVISYCFMKMFKFDNYRDYILSRKNEIENELNITIALLDEFII